jgi:hypothetical protein
MEPFSTELLTILVLICISLTGITCIACLIIFIVYIYTFCSKRRQAKSINPIRRHSTASTVSISNHSVPISPVPRKSPIRSTDQHRKPERHIQNYDTNSTMNENSYFNNKNKYQQQEYMLDKNDETVTTINDSRMYVQHHRKPNYQSVKPMADVRIMNRQTPYPPDVLAREKFMYNNRFSTDDKY